MMMFTLPEALNELRNDDKLVFRMKRIEKDNMKIFLKAKSDGFVYFECKEKDKSPYEVNASNYLNITNLFYIEPAEVPFKEAIYAFSRGKTIYVEMRETEKAVKYFYEPDEEDFMNGTYLKIVDDGYNCITAEEIINGKWFIKED